MAFRKVNSLFRHLSKDTHRNLLFNHQHHFIFTQRLHSPSTNFNSNRKHIFHTPYSPHINSLYSKCFNIIYAQLKRNYHHLHRSSYSIFNTHRYQHHRYTHNLFQNLSKRFASMDVEKDYYKILDVKKNATKKDIKSSYLKLVKQWHPDLHKNDKDKEKARTKFIEIQEAYEVLHDDGMRKKYDEMRRYGMSNEQYKYQEAWQRQTGQRASGFTGRGANPYSNAWEEEFRRNMQQEWEKIRREQQDWASARRAERHKYSDQFPFGNPYARNQGPQQGFGQTPFGFGPPPGSDGSGYGPQSPLDGFFRTMIYVFAFFMAFRLIGIILFGPRDDPRRRQRYGPGGPGGPYRDESPYYNNPSEYGRYNQSYPPPLSLREKHRKQKNRYADENEQYEQMVDEYDRKRKLRRGRYIPPPPPTPQQQREGRKGDTAVTPSDRSPSSPRPRNSLKDPRRRSKYDPKQTEIKEDDGNRITFRNPSDQQTTDISSPAEQRRKANKTKRSKYERMLEEQRMMEEVYIRARRKQLEEQEEERRQEMERRASSGRRRSGW